MSHDQLICSRCKTPKPDEEFYINVRELGRRGRHCYCKDCTRKRQRERENSFERVFARMADRAKT